MSPINFPDDLPVDTLYTAVGKLVFGLENSLGDFLKAHHADTGASIPPKLRRILEKRAKQKSLDESVKKGDFTKEESGRRQEQFEVELDRKISQGIDLGPPDIQRLLEETFLAEVFDWVCEVLKDDPRGEAARKVKENL